MELEIILEDGHAWFDFTVSNFGLTLTAVTWLVSHLELRDLYRISDEVVRIWVTLFPRELPAPVQLGAWW